MVDTGNDYFGNYGVVVGVSDKKPDLAGIELTKCKDNMDPSEVFKLNPMLKDKLLALWSRTLIEAKDFSWAKKVNDKIEKKTGDYLINELLIKYSISDLEDLKMVEKSWTKDELTRKIVRTNSIHASNIKNIKKIVASSDYTKYDKMLEEIIDTSQFDNERLNLLKVALIENHTKEQIEYIADPRNSFSRIEQLLDLMSKSLDYRLIRPYYTNSHTDDITKVMTSYSHKEATIFSRDDRYSNFSISSNAVGYVLKIIENQNTRPLLPYFSSPKFEKSDEHEIRIICQLLLNGYTPGEVDYIADISRRGLDHYNKVEYEYNKLSSNPPKNKSDYDGISLEYNFVAALIEELDSYSEPLYFDINGIEFTYLDPILVETKKGVRKAIPVGFYETIKNKKSIKKVLSLAPANYTLYPQEKSTAY